MPGTISAITDTMRETRFDLQTLLYRGRARHGAVRITRMACRLALPVLLAALGILVLSASPALTQAGGTNCTTNAQGQYACEGNQGGQVAFANGPASFADQVVAFNAGVYPNPDGTFTPPNQANNDPQNTLGPPNSSSDSIFPDGATSLGEGGSITVRFVDNVLTGSGDSDADLYTFEAGRDIEQFTVEVSEDCQTFTPVGLVGSGASQSGAIDIDQFGFGPDSLIRCVRITDNPGDSSAVGSFSGADIDAVGAISTRPANDLAITKTDSQDPVTAGEPFTYTLTVTNEGFTPQNNVAVTDDLPDSVRFGSATASQGGCDGAPQPGSQGGTVNCNLGTLQPGEEATVTIEVTPTQDGRITNSASTSSDSQDDNPADNTAREDTQVNTSADLAIVKQGPDQVDDGAQFTYTLTVTNNGPSLAQGATVTDDLPAGAEFVSASDGCQNDAGTVTCGPFDLGSGESRTFEIQARSTSPGDKENTATVDAQTTDPNQQNNSDTIVTEVDPEADLAVSKTDSQDPVLVGEEFTYTVTVTNNGPSRSDNTRLTERLPDGASPSGPLPDGCAYDEQTNDITCDLGRLANGASVERQFQVTSSTAGQKTNEAEVTSDTQDPQAGNNTAAEETTVTPPEETTSPETTVMETMEETTAPPEETTAPPEETTAPPTEETTAPPGGTTAPPRDDIS